MRGNHFSGEYLHTIDDRGRVTLPPVMRSGHENFYILKDTGARYLESVGGSDAGLDMSIDLGWLCLYAPEQFGQFAPVVPEELSFHERTLYGSSFSEPRNVDAQGRIVIPSSYLQYADLEMRGNVTIIGAVSRIELWSPDSLKKHHQRLKLLRRNIP